MPPLYSTSNVCRNSRCLKQKEKTQLKRGADYCIDCEVEILLHPNWEQQFRDKLQIWDPGKIS